MALIRLILESSSLHGRGETADQNRMNDAFFLCSFPALYPCIMLPRVVLQLWISRVLYPLSHKQGQKCSLCARLIVCPGVKMSRLSLRNSGVGNT